MIVLQTYTLRKVSEITGIPYARLVSDENKAKIGLIRVETVWNGKKKKRKDKDGKVVADGTENRVTVRYMHPDISKLLSTFLETIP